MKRLLKMLSEPSTYAGLGGLAVILGMDMETFNQIVLAVAGGVGFVASIIIKEVGDKP